MSYNPLSWFKRTPIVENPRILRARLRELANTVLITDESSPRSVARLRTFAQILLEQTK